MISITLINKKKDDNKKQKGRFSDLLGFGMSKISHDETNKRDFLALLYKYLNTCERKREYMRIIEQITKKLLFKSQASDFY